MGAVDAAGRSGFGLLALLPVGVDLDALTNIGRIVGTGRHAQDRPDDGKCRNGDRVRLQGPARRRAGGRRLGRWQLVAQDGPQPIQSVPTCWKETPRPPPAALPAEAHHYGLPRKCVEAANAWRACSHQRGSARHA